MLLSHSVTSLVYALGQASGKRAATWWRCQSVSCGWVWVCTR